MLQDEFRISSPKFGTRYYGNFMEYAVNITWDGKDHLVYVLPKGNYIYNINIGNQMLTGKILTHIAAT